MGFVLDKSTLGYHLSVVVCSCFVHSINGYICSLGVLAKVDIHENIGNLFADALECEGSGTVADNGYIVFVGTVFDIAAVRQLLC